MADISTPGSNADSSMNAGKNGASKDKACPFCQQPFTSSSLGRHLDLYIKEKNPKAADGIHDVDAIRKLRGGITRRQPRSSMSRREGSTPSGTPGVDSNGNSKRSPASEAGHKSPRVRSIPLDALADHSKKRAKPFSFHTPSWEATGVINDIPHVPRNEDYTEVESQRRFERGRSTSRQMLAKSTFDQKQKMMDALDSARAAELALREILGGIRAAAQRVQPSASPFDYDPLTLDFPALALHCLTPPPTLDQVTPIASSNSWSITPPEQQQYDALRNHFLDAFHSWRISIATRYSGEDESGYSQPRDSEEQLLASATDLENKISSHLHSTFSHWSSLSMGIRIEVWRLTLARSVGSKERSIQTLKSNTERILQENAHLRAQVEQLSRCQQPKEFQMMPPTTIPIDSKVAVELGNLGLRGGGTGLSLLDKDDSVQSQVEKSVARWRVVVQASRGARVQKTLPPGPQRNMNTHLQQQQQQQLQTVSTFSHDEIMDIDADADADCDEEGDEPYAVMNGVVGNTGSRVPEAPMMGYAGNGMNHEGANGHGNSYNHGTARRR